MWFTSYHLSCIYRDGATFCNGLSLDIIMCVSSLHLWRLLERWCSLFQRIISICCMVFGPSSLMAFREFLFQSHVWRWLCGFRAIISLTEMVQHFLKAILGDGNMVYKLHTLQAGSRNAKVRVKHMFRISHITCTRIEAL